MQGNKFTFFENNDAFQDSMMRSVLLFGYVNPKGKRIDQYRRAILSVVIYGDGKYDSKEVTNIFNEKFKLDVKEPDVRLQLNYLVRDGLVRTEDGIHYIAIDKDKKGRTFFASLEKGTEDMLSRVVGKVDKEKGLTISQKEIVKKNTKNALSLFYQINGECIFGLNTDKDIDDYDEVVKAATKGLDPKVGKVLVSVLAYTISDSPEDREVLEKWAKALISMRSLGLDPMLRNFKQQQLATKTFVLDTDVMLNALAGNARYSKAYHTMIGHLLAAGAKVLIPQFVYDEIVQNAKAAIRKFATNGVQLREYTDELLEDRKGNVFIEDYVKTIRREQKKKNMTFATYIGNVYSERSSYTLDHRIIKLLGEKNAKSPYELTDNILDEKTATKLKDIIKERAMKTPKGQGRSIEQQEEMALNDTRLYLTICQENDQKEAEGILGYQYYLLTRSTRTMYSATELGIYDKHVVCHPQTLIPILEEIGKIEDVTIINLFDNPFLTYTTELIKEQVEPLMEAGAQIQFYDFYHLREKSDLQLNDLLTAGAEERQKLVEKFTKAGMLFVKDWDDLIKENQKNQKSLEEAQMRVENLEKENKFLKGKRHYENRKLGLSRNLRKKRNKR